MGKEERENEKCEEKRNWDGEGGRATIMSLHGLGSVWRVAQKTNCFIC